MKIRYVILILVIILLALCIYTFFARFTLSDIGIRFTNNIDDYGADRYHLAAGIYLEEIPANAEVIRFSNYDCWNEVTDIYLELKFRSTDEMEHYLSDLRANCLNLLPNAAPPQNGSWFIKEQNPYTESYYDEFFVLYHTLENGKNYVGYSVEKNKNNTFDYSCHFALISYSFEELTVIQTYVSGRFQDTVHNYTPQYFIRFNVPTNDTYTRMHYWNEK